MSWLERIGKKNLIKLSIVFLFFVLVLIGLVYFILSDSIKNDETFEAVKIEKELKPSIERNEKEEKDAVQQIIAEVNADDSNLNFEPFMEPPKKETMGELSEESYNKYLKQFRLYAKNSEYTEMTNLAYVLRSQYNLNPEQRDTIYSFLNTEIFQLVIDETSTDDDLNAIISNFFSIEDIESKFYIFSQFSIARQGGIVSDLNITMLPRPINGVEILEVVSENVGWNESLAWKYCSDRNKTKIYKIVMKFNENNNSIYNIYYVENDVLGKFITNISCENKQAITSTYNEYFEMTGTEPEIALIDGGDI